MIANVHMNLSSLRLMGENVNAFCICVHLVVKQSLLTGCGGTQHCEMSSLSHFIGNQLIYCGEVHDDVISGSVVKRVNPRGFLILISVRG
jgi:hypothetical protein